MAARHQPDEENGVLDRIVGAALRGVMLEYEPEIERFVNGVNRVLAKHKRAQRQAIRKRPPARITRVEKVGRSTTP